MVAYHQFYGVKPNISVPGTSWAISHYQRATLVIHVSMMVTTPFLSPWPLLCWDSFILMEFRKPVSMAASPKVIPSPQRTATKTFHVLCSPPHCISQSFGEGPSWGMVRAWASGLYIMNPLQYSYFPKSLENFLYSRCSQLGRILLSHTACQPGDI